MKKTTILLALLTATSGLLFADEVFLKGAGSFTGRITGQTATMVTIDTGDGSVGIPIDRVDRIVKGRSALDDYQDRAKKLALDDAKGWRDLGRWAAHAGISTQSREAYEKVLAVAPDDPEAREALGFVSLNGTWMTEEDSFRARGFVEYDGEWMTPDEAQILQASAASEQALRDAEQRAVDAEVAQAVAEQDAEESRKRAEEAEEDAYNSVYDPVYWGGYGYGVNYWPSYGTNRTINRPVNRPVGGGIRR